MKSEPGWSHIADALPEPQVLVSPRGEICRSNRAFADMVGQSQDELGGKTIEEFVSASRPRLGELLRRCQRSRDTVRGSVRFMSRDSTDFRFDGIWIPATGDADPSILLRFSLKNVSAGPFVALREKINELNHQAARRRNTEKLLREQKEWLQGTLSSIGEGLIATNALGQIRLMNEEAQRLTGWPGAEAVGATVSEVFHAIDERSGELRLGAVTEALDKGRVVKRSGGLLTDREGKIRPIQETAAPIRNDRGQPIGAVLVFRDVTRERSAEKDIRRAKEVAESANRAKSEFLATLSHELRTPMNVVIGMTDLALDSELDADVRDNLSTAYEAAGNLLYLLDDLLDLSKIEARKIELDERPFKPRDVVYEAIRGLSLQAAEKQLELTCLVHPSVPDVVRGDAPRLRQILLNLLGNAVKFTESGDVSLSVRAKTRENRGCELQYTVEDTGLGISQADQGRIFSPFVQADSSSKRVFGGSGLGLSIVSALVERMGGELAVESELATGSSFRFTIPHHVDQEHDSTVTQRLPADLAAAEALVVDDRMSNASLVASLLSELGMRPTIATDVDVACRRLAKAASSGQPFRLAVVDGVMPGLDGRTLIESIDPSVTATVLMLSPTERKAHAERFDNLSVGAIVDKPIRPEDLLEAIRAAKGLPAETKKSGRGSGDALLRSESKRVLVAEDTPANQKLLKAFLRRAGHTTEVANDGNEAIALHAQETFDVILMDVQMPHVDGFEATQRIRAAELDTGERTPIIALSAHAMSGFREKCLDIGMDDYMAKPFTGAELNERIQAVTSPAGPPALRTPAPDESAQNHQPLSEPMVARFLDDFDELSSRIRTAIEQANKKELEHAAHALRGSSGFIKAEDVMDAAARLEKIGVSGRLDDAPDVFDQLVRALDALRENHPDSSTA